MRRRTVVRSPHWRYLRSVKTSIASQDDQGRYDQIDICVPMIDTSASMSFNLPYDIGTTPQVRFHLSYMHSIFYM